MRSVRNPVNHCVSINPEHFADNESVISFSNNNNWQYGNEYNDLDAEMHSTVQNEQVNEVDSIERGTRKSIGKCNGANAKSGRRLVFEFWKFKSDSKNDFD